MGDELVYGAAVFFFRAIEGEDGSWSCRRGLVAFDEHPTLPGALDHLRELAQSSTPALLVAHFLDGRVEQQGEVAPDPS